MSPILVRPVREQLEHDRIIRLLQTRFRRRFDVGINPGAEQNTPIGTGPSAFYPDVVLTSQDRGKQIAAIIEVETVESVNHLEALAEWVTFGKQRPSFHLYLPAAMMDVGKQLCTDHNVAVAEIHSYYAVGDEIRFVPVYRAPSESRARSAGTPKKAASKASGAKKSRPAKPAARHANQRPGTQTRGPARKTRGPARKTSGPARKTRTQPRARALTEAQIALPFLRFTRDKRGYETTSLVHALRGRHGRERQKLLYWFRTPPGVKVGRPALDEEAIRWIEEHNPEIDFDWQKILEATPPPAPQAEDAKSRRVRRGKTERRAPGPQRSPQQPQPPSVAVTATPESPSAQEQDEEGAIATIGEAVQREELDGRPAEDDAGVEGVADDDAPEAQAFEQLTHADAEELPAAAQSAVQTLVGHEQLVRLRARYAELQARITERGSDAAQIEALRGRAEPLNPDSWVTADEVKKGLEEFETALRDLRAELGLRRRRRSRRGGRRRRGGGTGQEAQTPAPAADSPSNSPDDAPDDTET